jgi:hypothetical protein
LDLFYRCVCHPVIASHDNQYHNAEFHYSFTIPSDWVEIPQTKVDDFYDRASKHAEGKAFPRYVSGFQKQGSKYFTYPYVLIEHHIGSGIKLSHLKKELENTYQTTFKDVSKAILLNAEPSVPMIDTN